MFEKILIANRGEVAVRIIKTCRRMGVATAVVFSEADASSLAVELADEAVAIGPSPAVQSYLDGCKIIAAAKSVGAQALHPGFGFLSERADFARDCAIAGLAFIGPNASAIEAMGDKIASKRFAQAAGVSIVPGFPDAIENAEHAASVARSIGYPVMIKASAGGGGKGIRIAWDEAQLLEGFVSVRGEAIGAFGDDRILIEKFIERPRHVEVQVLGDRHGQIVHLFERECSIQRRNQKVIEEAPSPLLDAATREAMGNQAIALARAVDYDSAGTVEFVMAPDKRFYFLEMNTRLQVEHPVTELITGVDLVEQMIRVAAGEPLSFTQSELVIRGWAIESRIYAEDPYRGFLPSTGRLVRYCAPPVGPGFGGTVRNDTGVREGDEISMFYDPMIAKLCVWGEDRRSAIACMAAALDHLEIEGVADNTAFLSAILDQERFGSGQLSTSYIADEFPDGFRGLAPTAFQDDLMLAVALYAHRLQTSRGAARAPWRTEWVVVIDGRERRVHATPQAGGIDVVVADAEAAMKLRDVTWRPGRKRFSASLNGRAFSAQLAPAPLGYDVRHRGTSARVLVLAPQAAALHSALPVKVVADSSRRVASPMPGVIVGFEIVVGAEIKAGEAIAVIEAMKMQNVVRAERDGVVRWVGVKVGDSVAADEVIVEFA